MLQGNAVRSLVERAQAVARKKREPVAILMNGVGVIMANLTEHTLTPASVNAAYHLWQMIRFNAPEAVRRMETTEKTANEYLEETELETFATWTWHLPTPDDYEICPHCKV